MLRMNEEVNALVLERAPDLKLFEAARRAGLSSLREECLSLVARGETTLEEVLRVTQERYETDVRRPTPDARRPTPDVRGPTSDVRRPTPGVRGPRS